MLHLLDPRAVIVGSAATTSTEVIGELSARLQSLGIVHASYVSAVIDRELTMPTGLPLADDFAVAVPHTDPVHVATPGLAVATLRQPVAFGSMDDPDVHLPVRVVFALALIDKKQQIDMLRQVAGLLQQPERLRRIAAATDVDAVLDALK